jgi:hypothetical protein
MARLTIAQLAAQLEAAHVAYQVLSTKYESLLATNGAPKRVSIPAVNLDYRAKLAAAKAAAISTGRSVLV